MNLMKAMSATSLALGEPMPRGYGFVRPSLWVGDYAYIAPIPFNFVLGLGHWFYWRVLVRGLGHKADVLAELRRQWIHEGWQRGYEDGMRHAFRVTTRVVRIGLEIERTADERTPEA